MVENLLNEWKVEKVMRLEIEVLIIESFLGLNFFVGNFCVLVFGSMFSMSYKGIILYIDIWVLLGDKDLDDLIYLF